PLPAEPGSFRLTRDLPHGDVRVEAHDAQGRRRAEALLARLDALAREAGEPGFVGQAMDGPPTD
ncbi:MAG TPA: DUF4031 domain-containing protein, partial [Brachybacterium paraconglomeratum]|nr:DUF4031 domain-containing protein [Brachybacterium paraconglomeratum]